MRASEPKYDRERAGSYPAGDGRGSFAFSACSPSVRPVTVRSLSYCGACIRTARLVVFLGSPGGAKDVGWGIGGRRPLNPDDVILYKAGSSLPGPNRLSLAREPVRFGQPGDHGRRRGVPDRWGPSTHYMASHAHALVAGSMACGGRRRRIASNQHVFSLRAGVRANVAKCWTGQIEERDPTTQPGECGLVDDGEEDLKKVERYARAPRMEVRCPGHVAP